MPKSWQYEPKKLRQLCLTSTYSSEARTNAHALTDCSYDIGRGKIVGQKAPFKVKDIWALRVRLQMESRIRELALFNLGIDSKLRGCDLVSLNGPGRLPRRPTGVSRGDATQNPATLIYRCTKNLRAVQLLLGHSKLESTVRYLGIEVDDALEIAEQTEI